MRELVISTFVQKLPGNLFFVVYEYEICSTLREEIRMSVYAGKLEGEYLKLTVKK
jgi:hypothetical protein